MVRSLADRTFQLSERLHEQHREVHDLPERGLRVRDHRPDLRRVDTACFFVAGPTKNLRFLEIRVRRTPKENCFECRRRCLRENAW